MAKRFMKLSVLPLVVVFSALGFSFKTKEINSSPMFVSPIEGGCVSVPTDKEANMMFQERVPFIGKSFLAFSKDLGFSESSGNYKAVNRLGYMGKYQFGTSALDWVGVRNKREFLNSPVLQEKAFKTLISLNKWVLKDYITKYEGQIINDVYITESGLIAAAHLGGAGNVKRFLDSNGTNIFTDANNVPITKYMTKFGGYDLSSIQANNNARV